jgi:hypothetical protein
VACNCGGAKTAPQTYVYTAPDGSKKEYRTEVEARAAQIRNGNKGTYAPK